MELWSRRKFFLIRLRAARFAGANKLLGARCPIRMARRQLHPHNPGSPEQASGR